MRSLLLLLFLLLLGSQKAHSCPFEHLAPMPPATKRFAHKYAKIVRDSIRYLERNSSMSDDSPEFFERYVQSQFGTEHPQYFRDFVLAYMESKVVSADGMETLREISWTKHLSIPDLLKLRQSWVNKVAADASSHTLAMNLFDRPWGVGQFRLDTQNEDIGLTVRETKLFESFGHNRVHNVRANAKFWTQHLKQHSAAEFTRAAVYDIKNYGQIDYMRKLSLLVPLSKSQIQVIHQTAVLKDLTERYEVPGPTMNLVYRQPWGMSQATGTQIYGQSNNPLVREQPAVAFSNIGRKSAERLTPQEREVLARLASAFGVKDIVRDFSQVEPILDAIRLLRAKPTKNEAD